MNSFPSDFNLVDRVFLRLDARVKDGGVAALTKAGQVVYQVWAALGLIGNGGFKYYLENGMDLLAAADAFDQLGLTNAASACRQVEQIAARCARRGEWRILRHHLEEFDPVIAPLNRVIFRLEREATRALAVHIRTHPLEK